MLWMLKTFPLPCYITLLRIVLAPVIVTLMLSGAWQWSCILFFGACLTDLLDGFVARRWQMESTLGKLLDPVADKILILSVMGAILYRTTDQLLIKMVLLFLIFKELLLLIGGAVLWLVFKKFIAPSFLSRLVAVFELLLIMSMMTLTFILYFYGMSVMACIIFGMLMMVFMLASVVTSCMLLWRYFWIVKKHVKISVAVDEKM